MQASGHCAAVVADRSSQHANRLFHLFRIPASQRLRPAASSASVTFASLLSWIRTVILAPRCSYAAVHPYTHSEMLRLTSVAAGAKGTGVICVMSVRSPRISSARSTIVRSSLARTATSRRSGTFVVSSLRQPKPSTQAHTLSVSLMAQSALIVRPQAYGIFYPRLRIRLSLYNLDSGGCSGAQASAPAAEVLLYFIVASTVLIANNA